MTYDLQARAAIYILRRAMYHMNESHDPREPFDHETYNLLRIKCQELREALKQYGEML